MTRTPRMSLPTSWRSFVGVFLCWLPSWKNSSARQISHSELQQRIGLAMKTAKPLIADDVDLHPDPVALSRAMRNLEKRVRALEGKQ